LFWEASKRHKIVAKLNPAPTPWLIKAEVAPNFYPVAIGVWPSLTCLPVFGPIIAGKFQFTACVIRAVGRGRTMKRSKFTEAQIAFILRQGEERHSGRPDQ
jgi:hypothetical protein